MRSTPSLVMLLTRQPISFKISNTLHTPVTFILAVLISFKTKLTSCLIPAIIISGLQQPNVLIARPNTTIPELRNTPFNQSIREHSTSLAILPQTQCVWVQTGQRDSISQISPSLLWRIFQPMFIQQRNLLDSMEYSDLVYLQVLTAQTRS